MPGYPAYQQVYPQPYQDRLAQIQSQYQQTIPQGQQVPQANQGLLWVQGEAGAKSYLVAPNTTVLLMDSEAQRFYLKSTDGAGMPNLRTFEYTEIVPNASMAVQSDSIDLDNKYVTRTEYEALQAKYTDILDRLNNFPVSNDSGNAGRKTETRSSGARSKGGNADE